MRLYSSAKTIFIIAVIILFGFFTVGIVNYFTYSDIIEDDIENISKLTTTTIYSQINKEIVKPIYVSLTMANDSFVIEWLKNENQSSRKEILNYLNGIRSQYGYSSVFLVSNSTNTYYRYNKVFKVIRPEDAYDAWYYNFIKQSHTYDLRVDYDEVDNNELTLFVNCRIRDGKGNFLGVIGVGIKMETLQQLINYYEENYHMEVFLINEEGFVQAHKDNRKIHKYNIFDDDKLKGMKEQILGNRSEMQNFKMKNNNFGGILISRYVEELNWYLIVRKDKSILAQSALNQLKNDLVVLLLVIIFIMFIITKVINRFRKQLTEMAQTDQLTGIANRRVFDQAILSAIDESQEERSSFTVMLFDIDRFKKINDTYGHILGDEIVKKIAHVTREHLKHPDIITRWGGDEFAGILFEDEQKAIDKIMQLQLSINNDEYLLQYKVTISIGATHYRPDDTVISLVKRADEGLYASKQNGRNQLSIV